MNSVTTTLRDTAKELTKLADYIDKNLPKALRDAEIKGFFIARHYKAPESVKFIQQEIIRNWEPRIPRLVNSMDMREYNSLREFLGIDHTGWDSFKIPVDAYRVHKSVFEDDEFENWNED